MSRYEKSLTRRGYVARNAVLSLLRRRLAPMLDREAATVTGWQLAEIIEDLEEAGERAAAATFRTRCSTFLNWCAFEAHAIEVNPLAGYRRGRDTRQERVAKSETGRALSDDELAAVWRTADPATSFGRLVRFLNLTGCRRGEGAKAGSIVTLTNTKMKEAAPPAPAAFELRPVVIGIKRDGESLRSAALVATLCPVVTRGAKLNGGQKTARKALEQARDKSGGSEMANCPVSLEDWRAEFYRIHTGESLEAKRKAFKRAREALVAKGLLAVDDDFYSEGAISWPAQ